MSQQKCLCFLHRWSKQLLDVQNAVNNFLLILKKNCRNGIARHSLFLLNSHYESKYCQHCIINSKPCVVSWCCRSNSSALIFISIFLSLYTDYHSFSNACGASDYYDPMCVCIRQVSLEQGVHYLGQFYVLVLKYS